MPSPENPFSPSFEELPSELAIFPLSRAVLLPRQELPLNIFEPRYVQMVLDSLGAARMIGMVQPKTDSSTDGPVPVYPVGCAGRITTFQESGDGRLLIQLTGVCRFRIAQEIVSGKPYRSVRPDWLSFTRDLELDDETPVGFEDLEAHLKRYAAAHKLQVRWDALKSLPSSELIDFLAIQLPFDVAEKQAMVESRNVHERAEVLRQALEMGSVTTSSSNATRH